MPLGLALALSACLPAPLGLQGRGQVAIAVRWPAAAFALMAMPAATRRVHLRISGVGIPAEAALEQQLSPQAGKAESQTFLDVPVGPKLVQALAYSAEGKLLATGEAQVVVAPNAIAEAKVVLQALGASPAPKPSPGDPSPDAPATPSGSPEAPTPSASPSPEAAASGTWRVVPFAGNGLAQRVDAPNLAGAGFNYPRQLLMDRARQCLWVADDEGRALRRIDLGSGEVATLWPRPSLATPAPAAVARPVGEATAPAAPHIAGLALGPDGGVYFADPNRHGIFRVDPTGASDPQRWAGGDAGFADGERLSLARFQRPMALVFGPSGEAYVADWGNRRIRRVSPGGQVTTVAGHEGEPLAPSGDALKVGLGQPGALVLSPDGTALIWAEPVEGRLMRLLLNSGQVGLLAGGHVGVDGEGGPATLAGLSMPLGLAWDDETSLLVADGWGLVVGEGNHTGLTSRVVRLGPEGRLERVAGQSNQAFGNFGDGGPAREALFNNPAGLAWVPSLGGWVVSDAYNHRLRLLLPPKREPSASPSAAPLASPDPQAST